MPETPPLILKLASAEVQAFLRRNEDADPRTVVLQKKTVAGLPVSEIATQLSGRQKAKAKLPAFFRTPGVLYPPALNLEQSSSEATAKFKASIVKEMIGNRRISGSTGVDLTGGFGVDAYFMANLFDNYHFVEPDKSLLQIAQWNHRKLGLTNVHYHSTTAEQFLDARHEFSFAFLDPSRRLNSRKVFRLSDCRPDATTLRERLAPGSVLLLKASPLLDVRQGLREMNDVIKTYVVAAGNECKELLFVCGPGADQQVVQCTELTNRPFTFSFDVADEHTATANFSDPLGYMYEPSAAILKAGAFRLTAMRFDLFKLHSNTHLYTSDVLKPDFPGRIFKILGTVASASPAVQFFPGKQANVITRNYPLSPAEVRRKLRIGDGGDLYVLGFSGRTKKFLLAAQRLDRTL